MEAKDIEIQYLGYDNVGNGRVYSVYENGRFKGGFVLEDFIFGHDSHQADFEEMAYRIALDVAKDENTKTSRASTTRLNNLRSSDNPRRIPLAPSDAPTRRLVGRFLSRW